MWKIPHHQLEEGHELATDLYTPGGQFLFPAHTELDASKIKTLARFDIRKFPVVKYKEYWLPEEKLDQLDRDYEILETKRVSCVKGSEAVSPTPESEPQQVTQSVIEARSPEKLSKTIDLLREYFDSREAESQSEKLDEFFQFSEELEDTVQHLLSLAQEVSDEELRKQLILRLKGAIQEMRARPGDETADLWNDIQKNLRDREELRTDVVDFVDSNESELEGMDAETLTKIEAQASPGQMPTTDQKPDSSPDRVETISEKTEEILREEGDVTDVKKQVRKLEETLPEADKNSDLLSQLSALLDQLDQQAEELPAELEEKLTRVLTKLRSDSVEPDPVLKRGLLLNLRQLRDQKWEQGLSGLRENFTELRDEKTAEKLISPLEDLVADILSERNELEEKIEAEIGDRRNRKKVLQSLESKSPPTVQELHELNVPPGLLPHFEDYYKFKNKRLSELWEELYQLVSSLESHFRSQFTEQLKTVINEFVNQSGSSRELSKIKTTESQAQEDQLKEIMEMAVTSKNYGRLATESELPESVVKSFVELHQTPEVANKWPQELLPLFERIIFSIFLLAEPKFDLTERYVKKMLDTFEAEVPLRKLLLQPPSPRAYLLTHVFNTSVIALLLGSREFNLAEEQLELLALGCGCSELGLTFVPESLFLSDEKLSPRGQRELSKHPIYSEKVAGRALGSLHPAVILAGQHHEYYDGNGYPRGLDVESQHRLLPPLRCADEYTAKLERRMYREPFPPDRALEIMEEERAKYNPRCLEGLREHVGYYPLRTPVLLEDNRLAIVKQQNSDAPREPVVWIITDSEQNRLEQVETCDLAAEKNIKVKKVLNK